ncbi:MAG: hypothetical protein GY756_20880 [bacterium]|nr:hypothetical protein [bacterium]
MKKLNLFLFIFIAMSLTIVSCDDDDSTNPASYEQQQALAQDYAFMQDVYNDIFDLLCQASSDPTLMTSGSATIGGAAVTYDAATETYVFTFPVIKTTNITTGSFTAVLNGNYKEQGTVANITFNNYSVGGNLVTGSNVIINTGTSVKKTTGPTISYTDSVYNATITRGTEVINVDAVYYVDWMLGDTTTTADDEYLFSGTANGSVVNSSKSFSAVISANNKVLVTTACQYIQSGIIDAVMNTLDANNQAVQTNVTIDFITSDGCNNLVQVNTDGTIVTFPM